MPRVNAQDFHNIFVEETLCEYERERTLRRAFLAVSVLDALVSQIFVEAHQKGIDPFELIGGRYVRRSDGKDVSPTDLSEEEFTEGADDIYYTREVEKKNKRAEAYYRERLAQENEAFRIVRDLAKANRHAKLIRGQPLVTSANDVVSRPSHARIGRFGPPMKEGETQIFVEVVIDQTITSRPFDSLIREAYEAVVHQLSLLDRRIGRTPQDYDWHDRSNTPA